MLVLQCMVHLCLATLEFQQLVTMVMVVYYLDYPHVLMSMQPTKVVSEVFPMDLVNTNTVTEVFLMDILPNNMVMEVFRKVVQAQVESPT